MLTIGATIRTAGKVGICNEIHTDKFNIPVTRTIGATTSILGKAGMYKVMHKDKMPVIQQIPNGTKNNLGQSRLAL